MQASLLEMLNAYRHAECVWSYLLYRSMPLNA